MISIRDCQKGGVVVLILDRGGGCGVSCAAFCDGECPEPQEISPEEIVEEHGEEDANSIMEYYPCFSPADHSTEEKEEVK